MRCPKCNGECLETKWFGIGIVYICKCCHEIYGDKNESNYAELDNDIKRAKDFIKE